MNDPCKTRNSKRTIDENTKPLNRQAATNAKKKKPDSASVCGFHHSQPNPGFTMVVVYFEPSAGVPACITVRHEKAAPTKIDHHLHNRNRYRYRVSKSGTRADWLTDFKPQCCSKHDPDIDPDIDIDFSINYQRPAVSFLRLLCLFAALNLLCVLDLLGVLGALAVQPACLANR